ncbi:MAG: bifunctional metallophosphatase/5'-nucleotidase [Nitrospiraceae bacterium]
MLGSMRFVCGVACPGLFWTALVCAVVLPHGALAEHLTILHTSEHHGQVLPIERMGQKREAGMAARAQVIASVRKGGGAVLVVDSGDLLIGTPMSSVFRGEPDIKAMNIMGYAAMAAGNHEFDFGLDHLRTMQAMAVFPILCTNLSGRGVELPCRPSTLIRMGDLSVGIVSVLGRRNFPDTFNRDVVRLLDLLDPIETIRNTVRNLRDGQGADLVIAITHEDDDEDLALLTQVPELDVVIGGHTPGFDGLRTASAAAPVAEVVHPGPVFVKTHRQGRTVGRLVLTFERSTGPTGRARVIKAEAGNLAVNEDVPLDPAVDDLVQGYVKKMDLLGGTIVGRSLVDLDGETETVRRRESPLGDLLADLARSEFGTDVALINGGQIRDSVPVGPVDLTRVLRVLPFSSSLVTCSISGLELRLALENSASRLPVSNGRFLQVSGMTVTYHVDASVGSRVRDVTIGTKPLEETRRYTVTADSFLVDGGDGYTMFQRAADRIDRQVPLRDLLLGALKASPLKAAVDGRIRFVNGETPPARDPVP